jgi:hypothetical protein
MRCVQFIFPDSPNGGSLRYRARRTPDLFIIATVVFPPLPQEGGCLAIATSAVLKKGSMGCLGNGRGFDSVEPN